MLKLLPILLFTISATVTPGPNNFMIMSSGLNFGTKKSLPHFLGICIGVPVMMLIIALGYGVVFEKYYWIRQILKIVGSVYMLYLAWLISRSVTRDINAQLSNPLSFIKAIAFQWVNPKSWLIGMGVVSIFTLSEDYLLNAISISILFFIVCIPCTGLWLWLGTFLKRILKTPKHQWYFNQAMALCLVLSIILIFIE